MSASSEDDKEYWIEALQGAILKLRYAGSNTNGGQPPQRLPANVSIGSSSLAHDLSKTQQRASPSSTSFTDFSLASPNYSSYQDTEEPQTKSPPSFTSAGPTSSNNNGGPAAIASRNATQSVGSKERVKVSAGMNPSSTSSATLSREAETAVLKMMTIAQLLERNGSQRDHHITRLKSLAFSFEPNIPMEQKKFLLFHFDNYERTSGRRKGEICFAISKKQILSNLLSNIARQFPQLGFGSTANSSSHALVLYTSDSSDWTQWDHSLTVDVAFIDMEIVHVRAIPIVSFLGKIPFETVKPSSSSSAATHEKISHKPQQPAGISFTTSKTFNNVIYATPAASNSSDPASFNGNIVDTKAFLNQIAAKFKNKGFFNQQPTPEQREQLSKLPDFHDVSNESHRIFLTINFHYYCQGGDRVDSVRSYFMPFDGQWTLEKTLAVLTRRYPSMDTFGKPQAALISLQWDGSSALFDRTATLVNLFLSQDLESLDVRVIVDDTSARSRSSELVLNAHVLYTGTHFGVRVDNMRGVIVGVHHDDFPHIYYTVRFEDGKEKQTDSSKLVLVQS